MKFSDKFIKESDDRAGMEREIPAPYFRKKFVLDFKPDHAEITICGLGFYELYINGKEITKGFLAPYISNPDEVLYYDCYRVEDLLTPGDNVIGILLGNGNRNPYGAFVWNTDRSSACGPVCVALCLEADRGDDHFILEADPTFRTHSSPILANDLRMEYKYDARLETEGWSEVEFDDSGWGYAITERNPRGVPVLCKAEPIRAQKELKAVSIQHYEELPFAYEGMMFSDPARELKPLESTIRRNVYVYDFGEDNAGVTKIRINGRPGQILTIRHMDYLYKGRPSINTVSFVWRDHYQKYIDHGQKDVFILRGGEETLLPKFKYDGFRYAFVEGLTPEQATEDAVTFLVLSSDIPRRADFHCSDETLNRLQDMTQRSDISNFYYFPTDCPHREKNGWTGDANLSAEQILLNFNAGNSLNVWLENVRAAQNGAGIIPGIVPTGGFGYGDAPGKYSYGPAWDGVCVNLPYYIYKYDGEKNVISDNLAMIMRMLVYQCSVADEHGLLDYGLSDWHDPVKWERRRPASPLRVTSTLAGYELAVRAAWMFGIIGRKREADYAFSVAQDLREAIRKNLIDFDSMTVEGDCQTSQAMAMEVGVFEDSEMTRAGKRLLEIIERDGNVSMCGCIGLRYLFHALVRIGQWNLAYRMIVCEKRPCYGLWVKLGSTTLQETFPYDDGRDVGSQNHHYMGDISSFLIQEIAGIKPNPSLRDISEFEISPLFIDDLDHAEGSYESKFGVLSARWRKTDAGICLAISVPEGMHGRVSLRGGYSMSGSESFAVSGGEHRYELISRNGGGAMKK